MKTFVTGASRGIGLAICKELVRHGHELLMTARSSANLKRAFGEIQKVHKAKIAILAQDLTDTDAIKNIKTFVKKHGAKLQNLVLNAGIYLEGDLRKGKCAALEEQMKVNFYANFELVQALLPFLDRSKPCRIVMLGSTAGIEASSAVPLYSITKWALRGYAVNLRRELLKEKIAVTYIAHGGTYTDMWKEEPPFRERIEEPIAKKLMEPADVAKMVAAILCLSGRADVEEIVMRPILGDMHH